MSFAKDIPDNSIIKLTSNSNIDSKILRKKLDDTNEIDKIGRNARIWVLNYINNNLKKEVKLLDNFLND